MKRPSGENSGAYSRAASFVRRRGLPAFPPAMSEIQILPRASNARSDPSGDRVGQRRIFAFNSGSPTGVSMRRSARRSSDTDAENGMRLSLAEAMSRRWILPPAQYTNDLASGVQAAPG